MKIVCILLMLALLTGCGAQETFETIADWYYEPVVSAGVIRVTLPQEAAVLASMDDGGSIYLCEGYSICMQTLASGDLERTLKTVTGFHSDRLQLIQTEQKNVKRYDFVWVAAGEGGDQLCRGAILDDGAFHYTLCVMSDADETGNYAETWDAIFSSFVLDDGEGSKTEANPSL